MIGILMLPDEQFMTRALELAHLGIGSVSPNPRVGCVIVHEGKIIGEGWHKKFGGPHAEVNAVNDVRDQSLLAESTVYVNLEPCSHTGKTPPCADLLIKHRVRRVVISNLDPHPLVNGRGISKLTDAGIDVQTGVLEQEGRHLNAAFFTFIEKKRPYIILKWAQSADGFLAGANGESKWISNEYSRQLVHRWRAEEDAVLVGSRTAQVDDPMLNVRDWSGRDPIRVVIDRCLKLPADLNLWKGPQKTLRYNTVHDVTNGTVTAVRLPERGFLDHMLRNLHGHGIQSVMVEGGAVTLNQFIESGLWDEARIFYAARSLGAGIAAPSISGVRVASRQIYSDELNILCHAENKYR